MGIAEIAKLLASYGPWGVAALGIGYGILERKERQGTQNKFDRLAETLPRELTGLVTEVKTTLIKWESRAEDVLRRLDR
jgi:hypothetical protein